MERRAVVAGEEQLAPKPFGQILVGDEVMAERDEIRVACCEKGRSTTSSKTAGCDQRAIDNVEVRECRSAGD